MDAKKVLSKVIYSVKPSKDEEIRIQNKIDEFINNLDKSLKKLRINAKIVLGGSFAKNTTIKKERYDADIFVVFDRKYKSDEISDRLEKAINALGLNALRLPGSRDYFNIQFENFRAEIVPVIKINKIKDIRNVTDASLMHVKYIEGKIRKNKKLSDEIRIAKAFCYANDCYGAESHIKGFSGYCLELLTSHYGGFVKLAKAASKWKDKSVVDPAKHYKKKNVMIELNESKLASPIIIIDPVQPNRNAAAGLSYEKFRIFTDMCKSFLKHPSENYFKKKEVDELEIKEKAKKSKSDLYIVDAKSDKKKEDTSGAKLLKLFELIKKNFANEKYNIEAKWSFSKNKAKMWFILKKPVKIIKTGPVLEMYEHVKRFKSKNKSWFTKDNRVYADIEPKNPEEILCLNKKQLAEMSIDGYKFYKIEI